MPRANEIKKGMVLDFNGKLLIKNIDIQSPSARGAATLYKMRFSDVRTGLKIQRALQRRRYRRYRHPDPPFRRLLLRRWQRIRVHG